ncbi:hypothetical protein [Sandaracinobacteroides hominis]|uniref:hypothetical protein n=1 Tax=Sandaracinobacteroides hominis TaxID=2780086 RepID=UPI0018F61B97|nr:hypothetical protein [Sandaracinobacteroides hominis]
MFAENSWVQVRMGQGILPGSWHPIAEKPTPQELEKLLENVCAHVAHTLGQLPDHATYVRQYCSARAAA